MPRGSYRCTSIGMGLSTFDMGYAAVVGYVDYHRHLTILQFALSKTWCSTRGDAIMTATGRTLSTTQFQAAGDGGRCSTTYGVASYTWWWLWAVPSMVSFGWAFLSSGKAPNEIVNYPPTFWPQENLFVENYRQIWVEAPFLLWIRNSAIVTSLTLIGTIASASVVAYSFARFEFPGRNAWFFLMLSTMMLPGEVTLIPSYLIFKTLGWVDSFKPLIAGVVRWRGV